MKIGNEYTLHNGTKCIIQYDGGERYYEFDGETYYIPQVGWGYGLYANATNQNNTHPTTDNLNQDYKTPITNNSTAPTGIMKFNNQTAENTTNNDQNDNCNTYETIEKNTNNSIPLESTGIPIAILLIAIVGSIIGLKRKK